VTNAEQRGLKLSTSPALCTHWTLVYYDRQTWDKDGVISRNFQQKAQD